MAASKKPTAVPSQSVAKEDLCKLLLCGRTRNNAMNLFGLFFAPFASTVAVLLIVLFAIRQ